MKSLLTCLLACCALALVGCASTIGNRSSLDTVQFEVGKTHKNDVADVLGLPASRVLEADAEYWGYRSSARLSSVMYPVVTSINQVTMQSAYVGSSTVEMADVAVIYTFNSAGTLVNVAKPVQQ